MRPRRCQRCGREEGRWTAGAAVPGHSRRIQTQFEHPRLPSREEGGALQCVCHRRAAGPAFQVQPGQDSRLPPPPRPTSTESRIVTSLPWLPLPPVKTWHPSDSRWGRLDLCEHSQVGTMGWGPSTSPPPRHTGLVSPRNKDLMTVASDK